MAKLSDISKIVKQALAKKEILEEGAKLALEIIPKRTRLGKGVKENLAEPHKLPALKQKTIKNRQILKRKGDLTGPGATPAKSGLNRSGNLLNSLKYKVNSKNFEIFLDTEQQDKAKDLIKQNENFKFMALSSAEFKRILKEITKKVELVLNKINFTDL